MPKIFIIHKVHKTNKYIYILHYIRHTAYRLLIIFCNCAKKISENENIQNI